MTKTKYEGEVITETVVASDMLSGMTIGTLQEDFSLSEADFLRLKNESSSVSGWALNISFAVIGWAISILPKWISEFSGNQEQVSKSEWIVLVIGVVIVLGLKGIAGFIPNEKTQLMKRMEKHFKEAPKSRQIFRGEK